MHYVEMYLKRWEIVLIALYDNAICICHFICLHFHKGDIQNQNILRFCYHHDI